MNDPTRLRDGDGAAHRLMAGAAMHVPSASRRRAVAFTSAAASLGASTVAVTASASSLLKSFVLCVALGAVGGGVASLAASETIARLDTNKAASPRSASPRSASQPQPVQLPAEAAAVAPPSEPPAEAAAVAPSVVELPAITEPARPASSKAAASGRDEAAAPSPEAPPAQPAAGSSLFEEQRIIESARAAVARGDLRGASLLLDNYERAYASKQFWPEALALRVEALQGSGQQGQARSLAAEFARRYPHHPLLQRVRAIVGK